MLIGYARVSTDDQKLNLQQDALRTAGCEKIFEDYLRVVSSFRPENRVKLKSLVPQRSYRTLSQLIFHVTW